MELSKGSSIDGKVLGVNDVEVVEGGMVDGELVVSEVVGDPSAMGVKPGGSTWGPNGSGDLRLDSRRRCSSGMSFGGRCGADRDVLGAVGELLSSTAGEVAIFVWAGMTFILGDIG